MRKKGRLTGFLQGLNFSARINEISALVMIQKAIETEEYKAEGYESVRDFCKEATGASYDVINNRIKTLKSIGTEITTILSNLGLTYKDARMIEHVLIDDPKTGKKVIKVDDDKIIPFTEDRIDEIQSYVDILKEKEKLSGKKLSGVEKEHKKEVKAMQEEVERLSALIPKDEEDREWAEKYIEEIDKASSKYDDALRAFTFGKKAFSDPVLQAKIMGKVEEMKTRFEQFASNIDAHIAEENE